MAAPTHEEQIAQLDAEFESTVVRRNTVMLEILDRQRAVTAINDELFNVDQRREGVKAEARAIRAARSVA